MAFFSSPQVTPKEVRSAPGGVCVFLAYFDHSRYFNKMVQPVRLPSHKLAEHSSFPEGANFEADMCL